MDLRVKIHFVQMISINGIQHISLSLKLRNYVLHQYQYIHQSYYIKCKYRDLLDALIIYKYNNRKQYGIYFNQMV
jgi:hypothetical protein